MRKYVKDNWTHYATEDIEAALVKLAASRAVLPPPKRKGQGEVGLRYAKEIPAGFPVHEGPRFCIVSRRSAWSSRARAFSPSIVRVLELNAVYAQLPPAIALVLGTTGSDYLPGEAAAHLVATIASACGFRSKKVNRSPLFFGSSGGVAELLPHAKRVAEAQPIRVLSATQKPPPGPRIPEAELVRRTYMQGQEARLLDWRAKRLSEAVGRYEAAYALRSEKLWGRVQAAGLDLPPRLSTAQLLRQLADELDARS